MTSLNLVMRNFNRLLEDNPSHLQSDDSYSVVEHCSHCVKPRSYYGFNWLDCNGWYLVVLGQNGAELFDTWWHWDSVGRYWLI